MSQTDGDDDRRLNMSGRREDDRWTLWDKRIRDVSLFVFGSIGFFHELLVRSDPDLTIIIASGALMGVPLILSADEKRKRT